MSVSTDVVVNVKMQFQSAGDARKAADAGLGIQRLMEQAQLASFARVTTAHRNAINEQITDVRRLESAYLSMIARVQAAWNAFRRGGGAGGGGMVAAAGGFGGGGGQRLLGGPGGGLIPAGGGPRVIEVEAIAKEVGAGVEKGMAAAAGGKAGGKAGPAFLSGGENKLLMITSATITALNAPKVILSGLTEGIKEIREGQFVENRFAGPGREFLGEVGGLINDQNPQTRGLIARMFGSIPGGGFMLQQMQGMAADAELKKKPGPIQREKTFEEVQSKRLDTERQLNTIMLERTKAEREMVDETKNRIKAAREEFGLLDVREKQATLDIARRVAAGGVGQLSSEELKFARGNVAFRGIIAEQAAAGADAAGFQQIVQLLGLDRKIAQAEAKIQAEVKSTINVDLDPAKLADALEERITPLVKEVEAITINKLRAQLNAQQNEAAALRRAGLGVGQ